MKLDFVGNQAAVSFLTKILESRRFSHAYLFYGEEGTGKRTLARQFAKGILCKESPSPCEKCASCHKVEKMIHPDLILLGDEKEKNYFRAEEIRSLRSEVSIKPNESAYRIFLLQNVQNLTDTAANSLLKMLEEPPSHAIFLLTCTNKQKLLPTIVSRCNPIPLFPVTEQECKEMLYNRYPEGLQREELDSLTWISGQAIGKALKILEDPIQKNALKIAREIEISLVKNQELPMILALAPLEEDRIFCQQTLLFFHRLLCHTIRSQAVCPETRHPLSQKYSLNQLLKMETLTKETIAAIEQNANLRLLLTWYASNLKQS